MANKSLQLLNLETARDLDQLKRVLQENFEALRIVIDGLTGERLETWTPVARDGSVGMTSDLSIVGGTVKTSTDSTTTNRAGVRGDKDGYFEYSHDNTTWFKLPIKAGTPGQVLMWPETGSTPYWSTASGGAVGLELDRLTSVLNLSTLILTDNGTNQTLTGSLGDINIVPAGGNIQFNSAYTFPAADGAANQILVTDGAGVLAWDTANDIVYCFTTTNSGWTFCATDDGTDLILTPDASATATRLKTNSFIIGTGADTDVVLTFHGNTNSGIITWMEDEDYLKFADDILMNSTERVYFSDTGSHIAHDGTGVCVTDDARIALAADLVTSSGGRTVNTTRKDSGDSPYTVLATDHVVFCDTDGGAITANLPAGVEGTHYKLINCGSSGNDLTVDPDGTEQLYGAGAGVAATLSDGEVIDIHYNATEGWW